jgi:hypothetical protein
MAKDDKESKIWSTVGVTLPVADYASIRFSFGHERFAKSYKPKDLAEAEDAMHEFNKTVLDRRLQEHKTMMTELLHGKSKKGKKK